MLSVLDERCTRVWQQTSATRGLTLAPEKTRVAGIDEGFDLLAACSREPCTMTTKSSAYRTKR